MEAAAQRGGRQVTESVGQGTVQFFRSIENPIAAMRRQFEAMVITTRTTRESIRQVGEEGAVAGETVSRGALRATGAMRALGVAGLAAYATYEVLNKTLAAAGDVAQRVFGTGLGAAASGTGITEFSAISQALFARGNVPQAETQNWLATFAEQQGQAARGMSPGIGAITQLNTILGQSGLIASTGIDPFHDTPEQMATKLARGLASMPEAQAYSTGAALGLSRQMVYGLRTTGAGLPADIAEQRSRAVTAPQEEAARRLIEAENRLATAWENLYRSIMLSGLANNLTRLANWLDSLIAPGTEDHRNFWQRFAPEFLGGRPPSTVAPGSATGALGIAATAQALGASDSAIAVMLSAASVEGGLGTDSWKPNQQGSSARGRWQLLGTELQNYLGEGNAPGDDAAQTRFVLRRLNEIMPGFSTSTDEAAQVAAITKFEASGQGPEYYARNLAQARQIVDSVHSRAASAPASTDGPSTIHVPDPLDWILGPVGTTTGPSASALLPPVSSIQRSNASSGSISTNHNYGDVNLHGNIVVNAPEREAGAIGNAVSDKVKQLTPLASTANSGLE